MSLFLISLLISFTAIATAGASALRSTNNNNNLANNDSRQLQVDLGSIVIVGGRVYYDINENGLYDGANNEPGVPNVDVQILSCSYNNEIIGFTRTNNSGEFVLRLDSPGCYLAAFDVNLYQFTSGGDIIDPLTGRTGSIDLDAGQTHFFDVGIVLPEDKVPTLSPTTVKPTYTPTVSYAPSSTPTESSFPTPCIVADVLSENIMSSSPIFRASYGALFSLSTPSRDNSNGREESLLFESDDDMEYIGITSLSLRSISPLHTSLASTNYQVYYKEGDYRGVDENGQPFDLRGGDLADWTLVADGDSLGSSQSDALIVDLGFQSGAVPSDKNDYPIQPSSLLSDGGMETLNSAGSAVTTYLYRIPASVFTPVLIPKYGGKVSFYVTLDRALLQYGDADTNEWDLVDVENSEYDVSNNSQDMNVRIHIGEGVTSYPWSDVKFFYSARRFLGKVWYEQVIETPCHLVSDTPSSMPSKPATSSPSDAIIVTDTTPDPTASHAPSATPTRSSSLSACIVRDVSVATIMSPSPIMRSSFGIVFSLSTPPNNGVTATLSGDSSEEIEYIHITSMSLRVLTPILSSESSTNYQVYYREGDYIGTDESGQYFDMRGDISEWTLAAEGNSFGSTHSSDDGGNVTSFSDQLIVDSNFASGVSSTDTTDATFSSNAILNDGGVETVSYLGSPIKTYLYQIPTSIFTPVLIPKHDGKVSFYVTLDRALLQYGDANVDEWNVVDVENDDYDSNDSKDMNVKVHVGQGVTSYPWTGIPNFYSPRRFLGKIWYEQIVETPCHLHESASSDAPSSMRTEPYAPSSMPSDSAVPTSKLTASDAPFESSSNDTQTTEALVNNTQITEVPGGYVTSTAATALATSTTFTDTPVVTTEVNAESVSTVITSATTQPITTSVSDMTGDSVDKTTVAPSSMTSAPIETEPTELPGGSITTTSATAVTEVLMLTTATTIQSTTTLASTMDASFITETNASTLSTTSATTIPADDKKQPDAANTAYKLSGKIDTALIGCLLAVLLYGC